MKFDNYKYLVFDESGKLLKNNVINLSKECSIEFNCNVNIIIDVETKRMNLTLTNGQLFVGSILINMCEKKIGSGDAYFIYVRYNQKYYGAIVYSENLSSVGFGLFYDWYKFFLPPKEPQCCCKGSFNKVQLPYVNKVMKSLVKYFNLQKYYGNSCVDKDLCISNIGVQPS
jgi:hypothetical protein